MFNKLAKKIGIIMDRAFQRPEYDLITLYNEIQRLNPKIPITIESDDNGRHYFCFPVEVKLSTIRCPRGIMYSETEGFTYK